MNDRNIIDTEIINAWTEASIDLGLQIQTPFILQLDNEQTIECMLIVKNFGSKLGTIIFNKTEWPTIKKLTSSDYGFSGLSLDYRKYDRDLFIDTLNDWGFCGDYKSKPIWYTGDFWGQKE